MHLRAYAVLGIALTSLLSLAACGGSDGGSPTSPVDNTASAPAVVTLSPGPDTLRWISATLQLSASVRNSAGLSLNSEVAWSSSATNVATVSPTGLVTAVAVGTTSIVARAGSVSGTAMIVVRQEPSTITKISGDSQKATVGELVGEPLIVEIKDQGGAVVPGAKLNWSVTGGGGSLETSSTETDVAGRGQASWRLGGSVGGQAVQVSAGSLSLVTFSAVGERLVAENVVLVPPHDTLYALGDTVRVEAIVTARSGVVIAGAQLSYTSSNSSIASVSASGLVTAVASGTTTISARSDDRTGVATIVVRQVPASIVKASGDGQSGSAGGDLPAPLVVEVRDARSNPIAGVPVGWSVTSGGGSVSPSTVSTTATGQSGTTWRLGSTLGEQSVQASVAGLGTVTFTARADRAPLASVELLPMADTANAVGDTVRFTAIARDAGGNALPGVTFTFISTNTSVATVGPSGLATAMGSGTTGIIASAESKADTALLVVLPPPEQAPVVITSVSPSVLVEGSEATITGSGFAPTTAGNQVSVGGQLALVTSASVSSLSITVPKEACKPPRRAPLTVSVGAKADSRTVGVSPRTEEDLALPEHYYRYTFAGNGCLHLPAAGEYLIGVVSTSSTPSSLTPVRLTGEPGDATVLAVAAPSLVPVQEGTAAFVGLANQSWRIPLRVPVEAPVPALRRPDHDDSEMSLRNEETVRRLGRASPIQRPQRSVPQSVTAGEVLTLYVGNRTCSFGNQVEAVVRLVGANAIWLEDLANPSGTFSDGELETLDAFYTANVQSVHADYFGGLSDVDGNGKIVVLMTERVNKVEGVAGWVQWLDLYSSAQCSTSNQAEIFYAFVPDPAGTLGTVRTKESVLDYYPSLLTHEITHLVQGNARVFGNAGSKTTWEIEGGATLAEQLVSYRLFGHTSGQDLNYTAYAAGRYWYWNAWLADMFLFFGWDTSGNGSGRVVGAPEQCSWVGRRGEGNTGPCEGSGVYGMPSMLLRFAMDRWGGSYAGGEQALMRRVVQSEVTGYSSLTDVSGWRIEQILADFYMALWADGRVYQAAGMRSWDLYDILSRYPANRQLQPYTSTAAGPQLSASIRAGSSLYLHWNPSGSLAPTSIQVTTPAGGSIGSNISIWALRLR